MSTIGQFALLGLGVGAAYALTAQGLLIIYRGSGLLNFAHGAIGMLAAFAAWDLNVRMDWPAWAAVLAGVAVSAAVGASMHFFIMRNLRRASPLARTVASLGVLLTIQSLVVLRYGTETIIVKSMLPTNSIELGGGVSLSSDRAGLILLAVVLTVALTCLYRFTGFGIATTAVAENQRVAASLGHSPDGIAFTNWALGSALGGVAAILLMPIVQLQVTTMTNLVIAALAVAMIARFSSFEVALVAGLLVGVAQSLIGRYTDVTGLAASVPFLVILAVMVVQGTGLPLRDAFLQRLPAVGSGRIRLWLVAAACVVTVLLIASLDYAWQDAFAVTFGVAIVLLSLVVVTGYAGQISLGQFALAGIGAYVAGRLSATQGWPFPVVTLIAVLVALPVGILFALPAVRTRGINLAIVSLGLGAGVSAMLFNDSELTGGFAGTTVEAPALFGASIDPILHPDRYAYFALAALVVVGLCVGNVRRGRSGRRLLAVRANERAAASLGISVARVKLYAFSLSAMIAALGGVVIAFHSPSIVYSSFDVMSSIGALAWVVIGGVGFVFGAVIGATFAPGALGTQATDSLLSGISDYVPLIGGLVLLLTVLVNQDGVARDVVAQFAGLAKRFTRGDGQSAATKLDQTSTKVVRVKPLALEVRDLEVRYGGVTAVQGLTLNVQPGKIMGLIGPNGAGKTSAIDAISGFTRASGDVVLGDRPVSRLSASQRSRAGLSRSFQSLELFEDMTVFDNLQCAADPQDTMSFVRDLIWPVQPELRAELLVAIREFGLDECLDARVEELSYGRRRLLSIARAVAMHPSILLLDEPAAGLGEHESDELAKLVRRLSDEWGMAVLLVEHDMNFVMSVCDEITVMDFGKMIAHGPPEAVRRDRRVVEAYLGHAEQAVEAKTQTPQLGPSPTGGGR